MNKFDNEIAETLRLAGVQLNEDRFQEILARMQQGRMTTVKELMEKLSKCDPNALIIISEKQGQGANQCYLYQGFTDSEGYELSEEQDEEFNIPAVELTCNM